jgi:hypothetical protein
VGDAAGSFLARSNHFYVKTTRNSSVPECKGAVFTKRSPKRSFSIISIVLGLFSRKLGLKIRALVTADKQDRALADYSNLRIR